MDSSEDADPNSEQPASAADKDLLRFSMRGLLAAFTASAMIAGAAVTFPTTVTLTALATLFIAMHHPQPFLRYFPRTTLLCFGSIGVAFVAGALYVGARDGTVDVSFAARLFIGSLFLVMTWISYTMVVRGEA